MEDRVALGQQRGGREHRIRRLEPGIEDRDLDALAPQAQLRQREDVQTPERHRRSAVVDLDRWRALNRGRRGGENSWSRRGPDETGDRLEVTHFRPDARGAK